MLNHWPVWLRNLAFTVTGVAWANRYAQRCKDQSSSQHAFLTRLFEQQGLKLSVYESEALNALGPCIVAGNHPHGLWDGIALAQVASQSGITTRVIARDFLSVFTPLNDTFLTVKLGKQRNLIARQSPVAPALAVLEQGGRVVITPAGGLSIAKPFWTKAEDPPWRSGIARLMVESHLPVVLIDVDAGHSPLRQLLHSVHPIVRSLVQLLAFRLRLAKPISLTVKRVVYPEHLPYESLKENALWLQQQLKNSR